MFALLMLPVTAAFRFDTRLPRLREGAQVAVELTREYCKNLRQIPCLRRRVIFMLIKGRHQHQVNRVPTSGCQISGRMHNPLQGLHRRHYRGDWDSSWNLEYSNHFMNWSFQNMVYQYLTADEICPAIGIENCSEGPTINESSFP